MMGVVLWSDPDDKKAVFWCEDHGDLAYYDGSMRDAAGEEFLSPGDMVDFDMTLERKVRRAHNAHVIQTRVCTGLQDHLRHSADQTPPEPRFSENVVELKPRMA